ncbi:MAG: head-tail connector protein [Lactobacillus sp.]|jgi:uncharacterized phage protein (predicted DNA packaging)|nr:head-tail connector protein [Lactobacillus sp.]
MPENLLTDTQLATLKVYLKVDQGIEDGMIESIYQAAATEIARAISFDLAPGYFLADERFKDRFFVAVMKQVKEEYDYRGLGSEVMRFPIQTPIVNIINQIRTELEAEADAN